jgi:membrane-bound lytic murein transglycosylase D
MFEAGYANIPEQKRFAEKVLFTRYKAGKRDTLASVAVRFGASPQTLAELNHLQKKTRVKGKTLIVPVLTASLGSKLEEKSERADIHKKDSKEFIKYYIVKEGDTLIALAKKFSVSANLLAAWNNLKEKIALRPGKRIIVAKYVEKKGSLIPATGSDG